MGNVLEVSIAVCLEKVIADKVLHFEIYEGHNDDETITKLALIASALRDCADTLRIDHYRLKHLALEPAIKSPLGRETWHLPSPSVIPSPNTSMPVLEFTSKLSRSNEQLNEEGDPSEMRSLFLAQYTAEGSLPEGVVVKFALTYNKDAHKLLADRGLAPKLHSCEPVIGGREMVVMERVKGKRMYDFREHSLPTSVFDDVAEALRILHEAQLVFGDLRDTNIMVIDKGSRTEVRAQLVDFDWVREDGKGVYSAAINPALIGTELSRDVRPRGLMHKVHDTWALEDLKWRYSHIPDQ